MPYINFISLDVPDFDIIASSASSYLNLAMTYLFKSKDLIIIESSECLTLHTYIIINISQPFSANIHTRHLQ